MIIVGFGFLMTFLKRHNYSSISYNFMIAAFVFLWNMFVRAQAPAALSTTRSGSQVSRLR